MKYEDIWEQHESEILTYIKSKINQHADARDILQEVALKLHIAILQNSSIKNPRSWLYQVTRHTVADYYRKQYRENQLSEYVPFKSQENTCICDLTAFVVKNYLPRKYAEAVYLSDLERRPQKEVASMLGISRTAAKSRIQRGRTKFKSLVEECLDLSFSPNGQIIDYQLKRECELPEELLKEMQRINLTL